MVDVFGRQINKTLNAKFDLGIFLVLSVGMGIGMSLLNKFLIDDAVENIKKEQQIGSEWHDGKIEEGSFTYV